MLPVTGPSNIFTYVFADALVQWLRRRPRTDRFLLRAAQFLPGRRVGGVLAARHGLAKAGMQLKYMGSKSWLAPHLDLLLGDVSVLHSLEYYLARRRPGLASALSLDCQIGPAGSKCLLVHRTPAGCAMRWQAS